MPEYQDQEQDQELEEEQEAGHCIPTLFPARLLDSCLARVESLLYRAGTRLAAQHSTHSEVTKYICRNNV